MPMPLLVSTGRVLLEGARASMQARSVLWVKAKGSAGVLTDGSGRAHAIQHGSAAGADSNDPLWLPYVGTQYVYFPGISGNHATSPDSVATSVTGDIDIRVWCAADDWTPAALQGIVVKWVDAGAASFILTLNAAGTLTLFISSDGTATLASPTSTVAVGAADGADKWVRVTRASATGSTKFYTSDDGASWAQLGTTVATTSGAIFDGTAAVLVGSARSTGTSNMFQGKVYRAQVRSNLLDDGTGIVFDADFTDTTKLVEPFSTFLEKSANAATVTINRASTGRKATVINADAYLLGTDDYFEIADAADLNFALTDPFTVCVLVRLQGTTASQVLLAKKQDLTTGRGYSLDRGAANAVRFNIGDATFGPAATAGAVTQGVATLVSGVRSVAADTVQAFGDGTGGSTASDTTTGTLLNTGVLRIGSLGNGAAGSYGDFVFLGAAIFREALPASDLARAKAELLS